MKEVYRMTPRQFRRSIILETGSYACLAVAYWSMKEHSLLAVLCGFVGALLYGSFFLLLGRRRRGYCAMVEQNLHPFLWRLLWILYTLRFCIRGAYCLSFLQGLVQDSLYQGSRLMVVIPVILVCGYAAVRSLVGRSRFVELVFWWVILPLVLLFFIGLWKVDYNVVFDMRGAVSGKELLGNGYLLLGLFLPLEFLLFRVAYLGCDDYQAWREGMRGILLTGAWVLLTFIVVNGILGQVWSSEAIYGVTDAMEQIQISGGGLERVDILVMLIWVVGLMVTLSAYLFQGQQLLRRVCSHPIPVWPRTILVTMATLAIYFAWDNVEDWTVWYQSYVCYVDIPFSILVPLVILVLAVFRERYRRRREPVDQQDYAWDRENGGSMVHMFRYLLGFVLLCTVATTVGCRQTDSVENRIYIKNMVIHQTTNGSYVCTYDYIDTDSEPDTNARLDYSHMEGIYLTPEIYNTKTGGAILESLWQKTGMVLSTHIYEYGVPQNVQLEETLGDWIRKYREQEEGQYFH